MFAKRLMLSSIALLVVAGLFLASAAVVVALGL